MNLEVVRSRAARGKGDIASVGRFAESASGELERAVALVQALLELARPLSSPVDLWSAMLPMVVLQNAIAGAAAASGSEAGSEGATAAVTLERLGDSPFVVAAPSTIARLAVASALEVAVGAATPAAVRCSIEMLRGDIVGDGEEEGSGQVVAVVLRCAAPLPSIDPAILECIEDGGVMLNVVSDGMRLDFRAAGRD